MATGTRAIRLGIIGRGRAGTAFSAAFREAGLTVYGPVGRGEVPENCDTILLCVPERALASLAAQLPPGVMLGHCSASEPLDALAPHDRFAMHPLMTLIGASTRFHGAACAIDGNNSESRERALRLAEAVGMRAIHVPADKRALYHAAASIGSNYLVTLEWAAEQAATKCGVPRDALLTLVRASLEAWGERGFAGAITGPVSRGDEETVARQRAAIAALIPDILPLFDVMTSTTRIALAQTAISRAAISHATIDGLQ